MVSDQFAVQTISEKQRWAGFEKTYSATGNKFILSSERQSAYPTTGN